MAADPHGNRGVYPSADEVANRCSAEVMERARSTEEAPQVKAKAKERLLAGQAIQEFGLAAARDSERVTVLRHRG